MNSPERATPRWLQPQPNGNRGASTAAEAAVLDEVLQALRAISHGSVTLSIQDGRVVQIETTEKRRL